MDQPDFWSGRRRLDDHWANDGNRGVRRHSVADQKVQLQVIAHDWSVRLRVAHGHIRQHADIVASDVWRGAAWFVLWLLHLCGVHDGG